MDKEVLFLKYLDGELTDPEIATVENMLRTNPEQKQIFEEVKKKRQQVFAAINSLWPETAAGIPEFVKPTLSNKTKTPRLGQWWHYAAVVALLISFSLVFYFTDFRAVEQAQSEIISEELLQSPAEEFMELNYYISPNRCWHNRQMVGSFSEFEFKNEIL